MKKTTKVKWGDNPKRDKKEEELYNHLFTIDEVLDIVLPMIVQEIVIAQKEGDKTSRLTSLYMKLVNIQHKIYD